MSTELKITSAFRGRKAVLALLMTAAVGLSGVQADAADTAATTETKTETTAPAFETTATSDAKATAATTPAAAGQGEDGAMIKLGDPTVATVNGTAIKRSEVLTFIGTLPDQVRQMPIQQLFPLAVDQVVTNKLISDKAEKANLAADPEVTKLYDQAKAQIIRNVYVERQVEQATSQKKLLDAYNKLLDTQKDVEEVHAHHILIATEEKAKDIIARLGKGEDFEKLAKENSADPSAAQNNGDLGYFAKGDMVPEFATAAFALKKGEFSKDAVKTKFGYHVIKVDDKRKRPEPKFEEVKTQLEVQARQQTLMDLVETWQKEAKIQKFDMNGEPVKATPKAK